MFFNSKKYIIFSNINNDKNNDFFISKKFIINI